MSNLSPVLLTIELSLTIHLVVNGGQAYHAVNQIQILTIYAKIVVTIVVCLLY